MTITQAISGAARRAASRKRMIFLYWFCQTVLAALAALPLVGAVVPLLAHSSYADELLKQFDPMFISEAFLSARESAPAAVTVLFVILAPLAVLAGIFLSGGAVKLMVRDDLIYSPREFWSGCGEYFWRFLRLFLYSLVLYVFARLFTRLLLKIPDRIWGEGTEEIPVVVSGWVINALLLLLCGIAATMVDYAKVRLVADDSRKSLRALCGSFLLVLRNPGKTIGAWLALVILLALCTLLYQPIANRIAPANLGLIALLILWQQLYIFARVWLRFLSWGTAAEFDPILRPVPLPPEEFVPVMATLKHEPPELEAGAAEDFII